jgi:hypothetical protein
MVTRSMARGKTTKCPMCESSMSAMRVKIPRSGKEEYAGTSYHCRECGAFLIAGPAEQ